MNTEAERIRYVVVGLGNIAQVAVLPAFQHAKENSELVGLVSSDDEKLRVLARDYDVAATGTYDEFERVLRDARADAVYVAVPNALHREYVERAAALGVHVLCEKPLGVTEDDCERMIAAARTHRVKLMVAYRLHFEAANLETIARVRAGEIGEPRLFSSVFCHQVREEDVRTRAELGGGALFDMGIYCLNAARYIFQDEPIEAFAEQVFGQDERSRDVDETTTAVLRFPKNRVAQFTASQGAADVAELRIVGTKGDIRLDPAYEYARDLEETVTVGEKSRKKTFSQRDQFAPELVYFSRCILEDTEPEPSGTHGLADVRIMQALVRSAKLGKKVPLTPVPLTQRPDPAMEITKPKSRKVEPVNAPAPSK